MSTCICGPSYVYHQYTLRWYQEQKSWILQYDIVILNLELPPGVELSQLLNCFGQVDLVGIPVPLLHLLGITDIKMKDISARTETVNGCESRAVVLSKRKCAWVNISQASGLKVNLSLRKHLQQAANIHARFWVFKIVNTIMKKKRKKKRKSNDNNLLQLPRCEVRVFLLAFS